RGRRPTQDFSRRATGGSTGPLPPRRSLGACAGSIPGPGRRRRAEPGRSRSSRRARRGRRYPVPAPPRFPEKSSGSGAMRASSPAARGPFSKRSWCAPRGGARSPGPRPFVGGTFRKGSGLAGPPRKRPDRRRERARGTPTSKDRDRQLEVTRGTKPRDDPRRRSGGQGPGAAREAAHRILLRVDEEGAWASRLLEALDGRELDPRDIGLAQEIVLGVLRWRGTLDDRLGRLSRRPIERL